MPSQKQSVSHYLNIGPIHVKLSNLSSRITKEDIMFLRNRLDNMFYDVQERFRAYGRPVRIITRLTPEKLGVMSYNGSVIIFYIVDTDKYTVSATLDYEIARILATRDVTYIKRAQVLSRLPQEYPGQPKELFSEIEQKLANPSRAGPEDYVFER